MLSNDYSEIILLYASWSAICTDIKKLSVEKMSLTVLIILLPMPCRLQFIFLLLLVGCLIVWASTKFLFLFSYPRVQVISHSFEIYCFTENIEVKNILSNVAETMQSPLPVISTSCHLETVVVLKLWTTIRSFFFLRFVYALNIVILCLLQFSVSVTGCITFLIVSVFCDQWQVAYVFSIYPLPGSTWWQQSDCH